jgi:hypothetical protein
MNQSQGEIKRYAVWGAIALSLLILLGWFVFRETSSSPVQELTKIEPAKPHTRDVAPAFPPSDNFSAEETASQPDDSAKTNAATFYRQAFALFDALSKEQKELVRGWQTNVDASVEAELCGKIRPICSLMHHATTVTNCDWGIEPMTFDTLLPHLSIARAIARTAIWNAAHCRSNDVTGAMDDTLAVLRLGQNISHTAIVGNYADMALQNIASSYVTQNIGAFRGVEGQRLAAALEDPFYEQEPSRAMKQEADMVERSTAKLASEHAAEAEKAFSELTDVMGTNPPSVDRATLLAEIKQVADLERDLAKVLASSSTEEYEAWRKRAEEIEASNPVAKALLPAYDSVIVKVQSAEVNRAMVVAGLAIAQQGPGALQTHPDPATGQPFVHTETADGFELQSGYQVKGAPLKMQFK